MCFFLLSACTKKKTDYEAEIAAVVPEQTTFKEAYFFSVDDYFVSIEALNGTFYKGYNEVHLILKHKANGEQLKDSQVKFLPLSNIGNDKLKACPARYTMTYNTKDKYFEGYAVFSSESNIENQWLLYLQFTVGDKVFQLKKAIDVKQQSNKNLNMTAFTGKDGEDYVIALISPQKPKVSENPLVAGIYKLNKSANIDPAAFPDSSQYSYSSVKSYTLQLDPRMPEPSMGNHSSPNNKDLVQLEDGLYHGVANYTMTGNWTLNFIMLNNNGRILKGTKVPTDFTPGVEGLKSELHIDILF